MTHTQTRVQTAPLSSCLSFWKTNKVNFIKRDKLETCINRVLSCAVNISLTVQSIRPFGIRLMKCLQTLCFVAVTWPFQNRQAWTGEYCSAVWLFWCTEQWKKKNVGPKRILWWSLNGSPPTTSLIFCLSGNIKYYKSLCLPDFHYIPITFWTISVTNQYPTL